MTVINKKRASVLREIRDGLRYGKYQHIPYDSFRYSELPRNTDTLLGFNMAWEEMATPCGAICCIRGLMERLDSQCLDGVKFGLAINEEDNLMTALCYPATSMDYNDITPEMAAHAIDLVLKGERPDYDVIAQGDIQ